jgi:hypothetical protein
MADDEESAVGTSLPPRKSDVLFGSGTDWQANACVASGFDDIIYQDGYRQAALHLVEHLCYKGSGQDFLVYPIIYLYRHHIELTLKSIIRTAYSLLDEAVTGKSSDPLTQHDLSKLWALARPLLNAVSKIADNSAFPLDDLEGIDSYIRQMHEHDPDGQRFRYPTTRKGTPSLRSDLTSINIRDLSNALEKLADYLEGTDNWLGDLIEAKAGYQAKHGLTPPHQHDFEAGG